MKREMENGRWKSPCVTLLTARRDWGGGEGGEARAEWDGGREGGEGKEGGREGRGKGREGGR